MQSGEADQPGQPYKEEKALETESRLRTKKTARKEREGPKTMGKQKVQRDLLRTRMHS